MKKFILILAALSAVALNTACSKKSGGGGGSDSADAYDDGCGSSYYAYGNQCIPDDNSDRKSFAQWVDVVNPSLYRKVLSDLNYCYKKSCKGLGNYLEVRLSVFDDSLPTQGFVQLAAGDGYRDLVLSRFATAYPVTGGYELRFRGKDFSDSYNDTIRVIAHPASNGKSTTVTLYYNADVFAEGTLTRVPNHLVNTGGTMGGGFGGAYGSGSYNGGFGGGFGGGLYGPRRY